MKKMPFLYVSVLAVTAIAVTIALRGTAMTRSGPLAPSDEKSRAPYVMFRPKPGTGAVNSLGFHSPEIGKVKKPGEYRIAMLGGSPVYDGDPVEKSIAGRLARILKDRDPAFKDREVTYVNAGIPSAVSGQELAQLIYHVVDLEIDLLIVFDGFNDFYMPVAGYDPRPGYPYDYIVQEYRYYRYTSDLRLTDRLLAFAESFRRPKDPATIMRRYFRELGRPFPGTDPLNGPQILDNYVRNIGTISRIASAYGMRPAVFLQPYSPDRGALDAASRRTLAQLYGAAQARLKDLASQNSPAGLFQDMSGFAVQLAPLFTDMERLDIDEGNERIAQEMYDAIRKQGLLS